MIRNPLNENDVDGNTIAWMNRNPDDFHLYQCKECKCRVMEDEWNHKRGMCFNCWWKI